MALEKIKFSHDKSMDAKRPSWRGQFGPKGYCWQDLCRGPLDIVTYLIYKLWAS